MESKTPAVGFLGLGMMGTALSANPFGAALTAGD